MAIVNNGTRISIPSKLIPTGFTPPAVTPFNDFESKRNITISVLKATVQSATKTTTLTNIISDATIGITKQITDLIAADYIAANNVQIYTQLTELSHNVEVNVDSDFFSNVAPSYVCKVTVFVKTV